MARRWSIAAGALLVGIAATPKIFAPMLRGYIRDRAAATLRERLDSDVTFGAIDVSVFPRVTLSGTNLSLRHRGRTDVPPLIRIKRFSAHAGLLPLLESTSHVKRVTIEGLEIHIPPRGSGAPAIQPRSNGRRPKTYPVVIDELVASETELVVMPNDPGKDPRIFQIHELTMQSLGLDRAAPFQAKLTNARPPGEIQTQGQFGPWKREDPGATPLAAAYAFTNADLGVFRGIAGILSSKGRFGGLLDTISVEGETATPDFRLRVGNHSVALRTFFTALVDGTNGNTLLTPVRARFLNTTLVANGGVAKPPGAKGRTTFLEVVSNEARLEDILRLAMKSGAPFMTGAMRFHTHFELPPGEAEIFDRLKLDCEFGVGGGRFTSVNIREKLKTLSRRAQGRPQDENAGSAVSNLTGHFKLANGVVKFSRLRFSVPGADVRLSGGYGFRGETLDFRGEVLLEASISQTVTGVKRFFLKAVDPLFRRNGAGAVLPIRITGTRSNPSFKLDIGRVFRRK